MFTHIRYKDGHYELICPNCGKSSPIIENLNSAYGAYISSISCNCCYNKRGIHTPICTLDDIKTLAIRDTKSQEDASKAVKDIYESLGIKTC